MRRWHSHGAWTRCPKATAKNRLDSRWVLKWKKRRDKAGNWETVITARLTARGFRDVQTVETFSATTSRWGQRLILVVAAQMGWSIISADVSQAFLRGVTFKTLAEAGEEVRVVELEVPPGSSHLLRRLRGLETFNEEVECLRLLKPGYGLKDAPRLWNMALTNAIRLHGMRPLTSDPQCFLKHNEKGDLVCVASTHVDDLKITGIPSEAEALIKALEEAFDALKVERGVFTHCGLQHEQSSNGDIKVHQEEYISKILPMGATAGKFVDKMEPLGSEELVTEYRSVLGAVAWATQTRPDVLVYVCALQRQMQKPRWLDVAHLNRIILYMQHRPLHLLYKKVTPPLQILLISDSAFQSKGQDCLAIKSGAVALASASVDLSKPETINIMALDWLSRKQTHVCRSTFAAEIHACCDLVGIGIKINSAMHELKHGANGAVAILDTPRDQLGLPMRLVLDAEAVFNAVVAAQAKTPADA